MWVASAMWVAPDDLPRSAGHPFYERLNRVLSAAGFDAFVEDLCAKFYAAMGRPSLAPGRYFRLLLVGYFEGLGSERAMAWRAADSPHDPDSKVAKMKDGSTHMAHKVEHAVDLESGAVVGVTLQGADEG